jgi:hypothetical protein
MNRRGQNAPRRLRSRRLGVGVLPLAELRAGRRVDVGLRLGAPGVLLDRFRLLRAELDRRTSVAAADGALLVTGGDVLPVVALVPRPALLVVLGYREVLMCEAWVAGELARREVGLDGVERLREGQLVRDLARQMLPITSR